MGNKMTNSIFLLRISFSLVLTALTGGAQAVALAPQYAGIYHNGDGANSQWVQVSENWRGAMQGNETWGTGIWGLADQATVMGLHSGNANVIQTLSRKVNQINFSDQVFINTGGAKWGTPQLAPIFNNASGENQDNWASRFTGYLSITSAGDYNLGVLYDDGFRLSLMGAGGQKVELVKDGLNSPDRLGFDQNLQLSTGLYAFQLDAYERLEAGVVQLAWWTPGGGLAIVPQENLFTSPVPEPSTPLLMLAGLAIIGWRTLKCS